MRYPAAFLSLAVLALLLVLSAVLLLVLILVLLLVLLLVLILPSVLRILAHFHPRFLSPSGFCR